MSQLHRFDLSLPIRRRTEPTQKDTTRFETGTTSASSVVKCRQPLLGGAPEQRPALDCVGPKPVAQAVDRGVEAGGAVEGQRELHCARIAQVAERDAEQG